MIQLSCPGCGTALSVPPDLAGKKCRCPKCQRVCSVCAPTPTLVEARSGRPAPVPEQPAPRWEPTVNEKPPAAAPDVGAPVGKWERTVNENRPAESATPPSLTALSTGGGDSGPRFPSDIPGYEILEELGRGGMGVVYKARQIKANRLVALKMILAGGHADGAERQRFQTEAEAVARLHHPHIVQIHEVGEQHGQPFFSLEFLEGGTLGGKLAGNPLPPREAAALLEKLARAVHAAHQGGIIHRDLKPANVLLTKEGEPKITDFGLAKHTEVDNGQTRTGAVVGTPKYMAPEQALGETKRVGPAADVYSLGVMLYEFLTGSTQFKGATPMDTMMQVVSAEPVPPSQIQPKVPRDLETICMKCLQKKPDRRYPSAGDLADELRRYLDGLPIQARPVGTWERAVKWARRRPAVAALIVVSFVGVLTLLLGSLFFSNALLAAKLVAEEAAREAKKNEEIANYEKRLAEDQRGIAENAQREAEAAKHEVQDQLDRVRQSLLTAQLAQASTLWRTDPGLGLRLLLDRQNCPPALRDFSWYYYHRLCLAERGVFPAGGTDHIAVAFSPDGKLMAAGGGDGVLRIWDFASQKLLQQCKGHTDWVGGVVFSRDGKKVFSSSADKTVREWDVGNGREVKKIGTVSGMSRCLALHPDGEWLAAGSYQDKAPPANNRSDRFQKGEVVLFNLKTGERKVVLPNDPSAVFSVAFSPDGSLLAASTAFTHKVILWEVPSGKEYGVFRTEVGGMWGYAHGVAFSHNGKYLAYGSADRMIHVWDIKEKKRVTPSFVGHLRDVFQVEFSRDDKTLLSVSGDNSVRLWDVETRREVFTLRECNVTPAAFSPDGKGIVCQRGADLLNLAIPSQPEQFTLNDHHDGILQVAFSPDGKHLASTGKDGSARLWNPLTGTHIQHLGGNGGDPQKCLAFSPDSQTIFLGGVRVTEDKKKVHAVIPFDVKTRTRKAPLADHPAPVAALAVSGPHSWLVSGSEDGTLKWWDLAANRELGSFSFEKKPIHALAFHPTEKMLAGHVGESFVLWSLADSPPKLIREPLSVGPRFAFAFSLDGQSLAVQSGQSVDLLKSATGKKLGTIGPANAEIRSLAFCPDRTTLAVGLSDRNLQFWNVPFRQLRAILSGHLNEVTALAFHPDGKILASGSCDTQGALWGKGGEIKLWSGVYTRPIGSGNPRRMIEFSEDGSKLFTGPSVQNLVVWDTATETEQSNLQQALKDDVAGSHVSLTPHGSRIITVLPEGSFVVLDSTTGEELANVKRNLPYPGPSRLLFSADGQTLILPCSSDNTLRLVDLKTYQETGKLKVPGALEKGWMDLSADSRWLLQARFKSRTVEVFDLKNASRIELEGHTDQVNFVRCLPGNRAATGSSDKTVIIWDLTTGKSAQRLEGHTGEVWHQALSRSGKFLATGSARGELKEGKVTGWEIRVWDLETFKEPRQPLVLPAEGRMDLAISPQDELLIAQAYGTGIKFHPRVKLAGP